MTGRPDGLPRVIELVRVSTDGQHDADTPEIQHHALDGLRAQRPGRLIERVEAPGGLSGALPIAERPDVLRVRALIEQHGVDEFRVYAIDRITRADSIAERVYVLDLIARAKGVIVEAAGGGAGRVIDPRDDVGEMEFLMRAMWARREREKIRERTQGGKRRQAVRGRIVGQHPGYGWHRQAENTGRVEIDERAAAVVRRIYRWYLDGLSHRAIADRLDAEAVPTPPAGRTMRRKREGWSPMTVGHILRSPQYRGVYPQTAAGQVIETPVPPIVDDETWYGVQGIREARARRGGARGSVPALARRRLRCGRCGAPMYVRAPRPDRGIVGGYRCRSMRTDLRGVPCGAPSVRLDAVDAALWEVVREVIEHPDLVAEAATVDDGAIAAWDAQIGEAERRLERCRRDEQDVYALLSEGLATPEGARSRLRQIGTDRTEAERTIETARRGIAEHERLASVTDLASLRALRDQIEGADFETRRTLVEVVIPEADGYGAWIDETGALTVVGALPAPTRPTAPPPST